MTPQERQMVADLFDRLASLEGQRRDPDADRLMRDGLARAPNAVYALVQSVLVQDEALKRASARIEELEQTAREAPPAPAGGGGFLDSMRNVFTGREPPRSSVPPVRPGGFESQQGSSGAWGPRPEQPAGYPPGYPQGYPQGGPMQAGPAQGGPWGGPMGGGMGAPAPSRGGSFLGTAAAAAAGVVGGSMLLGGIRGMFGEHSHASAAGVPDQPAHTGGGTWANAGAGDLSRDAGVNDVGTQRNAAYDPAAYEDGGNPNSGASYYNQNAYEQDAGDGSGNDDQGGDVGDFGGGGDSDTA